MRNKRKAAITCLNQIHNYFKSSFNVKTVTDEELGSSESYIGTDDEESSENFSDEEYSEYSHGENSKVVDIDNIDECILKEPLPKLSKSAMKSRVKAIQAASLHLRARQTDIDSGLSLLKWHFNTNFNHFHKLSKSAYWADKILIDADRSNCDIFNYLSEAFFPTKNFMVDISKTDKKIDLLGSLSTINVALPSSVQLRNDLLPPLSSVCVPNPVVDQHGAFINTGTFIKRMSWAPLHPQLHEDQFLAVSVYRELAERCSANESGRRNMIQIYNCGPLTMSTRKAGTPRLEMVFTHDWGKVTDLSWSPQPLPAVSRSQRLIGHLAMCCTDGFVRIVPIGKLRTPGCLVMLDINHPVLCLGPVRAGSTGVFPTTMHWRQQFPDRLVVGYNNGAVAMFVLTSDAFSTARMTRVVMNVCLRPAIVRHVFRDAACRSMQICPHDWQLVAVSSTVTASAVLVDFRPQSKTAFPSQIDLEATVGARVIWPVPGDVLVLAAAKHIGNNPGLFVCAAQQPPKHARKLYSPLISAIDFCDSLNIIPFGTRSGQLNLFSMNSNHVNHLLRPRSVSYKDYRDGAMRSKFYFQYCLVATDDIQPVLAPVKSEYPARANGCSCAPGLQCVHKLLSKYSISITETADNKPHDWQLDAMLNINEITANPNPSSCTWIAVGLECGLIHLVPLTHFYNSELDKISTGSSCNILDIASKQLFDEFILPKTLTYFTKYGRPRLQTIKCKKDTKAKIKSETASVHFENTESVISASLFPVKTKNSFITDYFTHSPAKTISPIAGKRKSRSFKITSKSPINRSPIRGLFKNSKKADTKSKAKSKIIMRFKRNDHESSISSFRCRLVSANSSGGRILHSHNKSRSNLLESSSEDNSISSSFCKRLRSHKSTKVSRLKSTRNSNSFRNRTYSFESSEESDTIINIKSKKNNEKQPKIKSFRKRLRSYDNEPSKINSELETTEIEVSNSHCVTRSRSKSSVSNSLNVSSFDEMPSPIPHSSNRLSFPDFLKQSDSVMQLIESNNKRVEAPKPFRKRLVSIDDEHIKENSTKVDISQVEMSTSNRVTRSVLKSIISNNTDIVSVDQITTPVKQYSTKQTAEFNNKQVEKPVKKPVSKRLVSQNSEHIQQNNTKIDIPHVEESTSNRFTRGSFKTSVSYNQNILSGDEMLSPKMNNKNVIRSLDNSKILESNSKIIERRATESIRKRLVSHDNEHIQDITPKIDIPQVKESTNNRVTRSTFKTSVSNSQNILSGDEMISLTVNVENVISLDKSKKSEPSDRISVSCTKTIERTATEAVRKRLVSHHSEHNQENTKIDIPQVEESTNNRLTRSTFKTSISNIHSILSGDEIVNSKKSESSSKIIEAPVTKTCSKRLVSQDFDYIKEKSTKNISQTGMSTSHRFTRNSLISLNTKDIFSDEEMPSPIVNCRNVLKECGPFSHIPESNNKVSPTVKSCRERLISCGSESSIATPDQRVTRNKFKSSMSNGMNIVSGDEMMTPVLSSNKLVVCIEDIMVPVGNQTKTKISKKNSVPEKKNISVENKRKDSDKQKPSKIRKRGIIDDSSGSEEIVVPKKRPKTRSAKKAETLLSVIGNSGDSSNSPSFSNEFETDECTTTKPTDFKLPTLNPPEDKKSDKLSVHINEKEIITNDISETRIPSPQKSRKITPPNAITFTAFKRMLNTDIDDEDNSEVYINMDNRGSMTRSPCAKKVVSMNPVTSIVPLTEPLEKLDKSSKVVTLTDINILPNTKLATHEQHTGTGVKHSTNKQPETLSTPFKKFKTAPISQSTPKANKIMNVDENFDNEPQLVLVKSKTKVNESTKPSKDQKVKKTKTKTKEFDMNKVNKLQNIFSIKRRELLESQSVSVSSSQVAVTPSPVVKSSWWGSDNFPQRVPDVDLDINKIDDISLGGSPKKKLNSSCCTDDRMDKIKKVIDRGVSQSDIDRNMVAEDFPELLQPFRPLKLSKSVNYSPSTVSQII